MRKAFKTMEFGKLPDITHVDFTLRATPPSTYAVLKKHFRAGQPLDCYIGATGWGMKEWVGTVYPAGAKSKDYLQHYARQFNTIELNTTHYRIPTPETIAKWHAEAAPDFRFCPKVPQTISHSRNLGLGSDQIRLFCDAVRQLREKLGCCFLQLPPYFDAMRLPLLEAFLQAFPEDIPLAVEVRHESWFADEKNAESLFLALEKYQVATVIPDVAGRRDVLHLSLSTPTAMVRFVGNGLHPSDYTRLDDWAARLREWQAAGLATVYFFTHEPDNLHAPHIAQYFCERLQAENFPGPTRGPQFPADDAPKQMSLF